MKTKYIIKDWADNIKFEGRTFKSFEDADEFLTLEIELWYPDTIENEDRFYEEKGEFFIQELHY